MEYIFLHLVLLYCLFPLTFNGLTECNYLFWKIMYFLVHYWVKKYNLLLVCDKRTTWYYNTSMRKTFPSIRDLKYYRELDFFCYYFWFFFFLLSFFKSILWIFMCGTKTFQFFFLFWWSKLENTVLEQNEDFWKM